MVGHSLRQVPMRAFGIHLLICRAYSEFPLGLVNVPGAGSGSAGHA